MLFGQFIARYCTRMIWVKWLVATTTSDWCMTGGVAVILSAVVTLLILLLYRLCHASVQRWVEGKYATAQPTFCVGPNLAKLPCFQASTGHRVNSKAEEIKLQVSGTHDINSHCHCRYCSTLKILGFHQKKVVDSWRAFQGKRPLSIPRPRLHVASLGWSTVSQAQLPQDRLKPQESRLKSEDDEDDWLPALRKLQLGTVGRPCYALLQGTSLEFFFTISTFLVILAGIIAGCWPKSCKRITTFCIYSMVIMGITEGGTAIPKKKCWSSRHCHESMKPKARRWLHW